MFSDFATFLWLELLQLSLLGDAEQEFLPLISLSNSFFILLADLKFMSLTLEYGTSFT